MESRHILLLAVAVCFAASVEGSVRVGMYNAELFLGNPRYQTVRPFVFDTQIPILARDYDAICINELYESFDRDEAETLLTTTHPYVLANPNIDISVPDGCGCQGVDQSALLTCVSTQCADGSFSCFLQNCFPQFSALPNICFFCYSKFTTALALEQITVAEVTTICNSRPQGDLFDCAGSPSDGVMLASRFPMRDIVEMPLMRAPAILRGALCGTMEHPDGDVRVCCTHLHFTTTVSFEERVATPPDLLAVQMDQARQYLDAGEIEQGMPIILAGDFNSSPQNLTRQIWGEAEDTYNFFLQAGFTNPYVDMIGRCTWCVEFNPTSEYPAFPALAPEIEDATNGAILMHMFIKNFPFDACIVPQRILDDTILLPNPDLFASDHYGVGLTIEGLERGAAASSANFGASLVVASLVALVSLF